MRRVGFLIFPDFQLLDAAGPISALEIAGRYGRGAYGLFVLAAVPGEVKSSAGVPLCATALGDAPGLDTLIIAGGDGVEAAADDPAVLAYVRACEAAGVRLASVCSGAYVLAAAGLLAGRRATTHWSRTQHFVRRFPDVRLEPDRIFIREGRIWTSAGITAGIDLSLALIAEDLGEDIARKTAQQMVVYRQRPGGQSQFSALLQLEKPGGRFGPLLAWARERLGEPLPVERLAEQAGMSPRNFARRFVEETGLTPARAIERLRVEAARAQVETGAAPLDLLAQTTGFGDPERMRSAFIRAFGQPPQALRRAARGVIRAKPSPPSPLSPVSP